jgi:Na+/proline symporter
MRSRSRLLVPLVVCAVTLGSASVASATTDTLGTHAGPPLVARSSQVADTASPAIGALPSGSRVSSSTFQGDCSWVTCTIRLNRAATRNARDASWLIGAAAGACAVVTEGAGAVVCGAAIAPAAVTLAVAAGRYYESGRCLGIKFTHPPVPSVAWPSSVKYGTRNCS